jgi:RimJ/RimL family protein N-acetyltransferase
VELRPLERYHHDELVEAVKDGELWRLWYTSIPKPEAMAAEIDRRLDLQSAGTMLPFTVIERVTGQAVGMTTYMNIDTQSPRLEIGSTWYARRVQRTPLNTEAKLLLLSHAFDTIDCIARRKPRFLAVFLSPTLPNPINRTVFPGEPGQNPSLDHLEAGSPMERR